LRDELGIKYPNIDDFDMIQSKGGVFEIKQINSSSDEILLFSKIATGRFPHQDEIKIKL